MPLLIPAVSAERKWSKTDSGTILSSFFWGYTLTQVCYLITILLIRFHVNYFELKVFGGYLSDKIGGEKVILLSAIGWSMITFWMPNFISMWNLSIPFIVTIRIINGACQGVHFPSMISITSQVGICLHLLDELIAT